MGIFREEIVFSESVSLTEQGILKAVKSLSGLPVAIVENHLEERDRYFEISFSLAVEGYEEDYIFIEADKRKSETDSLNIEVTLGANNEPTLFYAIVNTLLNLGGQLKNKRELGSGALFYNEKMMLFPMPLEQYSGKQLERERALRKEKWTLILLSPLLIPFYIILGLFSLIKMPFSVLIGIYQYSKENPNFILGKNKNILIRVLGWIGLLLWIPIGLLYAVICIPFIFIKFIYQMWKNDDVTEISQ